VNSVSNFRQANRPLKKLAREKSRVFFIFAVMETYIFQHVEYEGPGAILPYLQAKGHNVHIVRLYAGDPIPHEDDVDFAILMGGPMSVLDETKYPHFVREKELCCDMVQLGKPLLGICLGAQMIASAFGAAIKKNPEKEIGWFPVTFTGDAVEEMNLPESLDVFHWHGETFDIPELPGIAEPFAFSEACQNQAFKIGSGIALQFHLEATPKSMESMLKNGDDEIKAGIAAGFDYVQNPKDIRIAGKTAMGPANELLVKILDYLLEEK
jgi:GMP synthase-like glutamine amidotransferase